MATPWDGAVRVLREVVVQRVAPQELVAISQVAGLVGEEMSLDVIAGGASVGLRVKVLESAPMMFNGTVRHRLRLKMLNAAAPAEELSHSPVAERAALEI